MKHFQNHTEYIYMYKEHDKIKAMKQDYKTIQSGPKSHTAALMLLKSQREKGFDKQLREMGRITTKHLKTNKTILKLTPNSIGRQSEAVARKE